MFWDLGVFESHWEQTLYGLAAALLAARALLNFASRSKSNLAASLEGVHLLGLALVCVFLAFPKTSDDHLQPTKLEVNECAVLTYFAMEGIFMIQLRWMSERKLTFGSIFLYSVFVPVALLYASWESLPHINNVYLWFGIWSLIDLSLIYTNYYALRQVLLNNPDLKSSLSKRKNVLFFCSLFHLGYFIVLKIFHKKFENISYGVFEEKTNIAMFHIPLALISTTILFSSLDLHGLTRRTSTGMLSFHSLEPEEPKIDVDSAFDFMLQADEGQGSDTSSNYGSLNEELIVLPPESDS